MLADVALDRVPQVRRLHVGDAFNVFVDRPDRRLRLRRQQLLPVADVRAVVRVRRRVLGRLEFFFKLKFLPPFTCLDHP